MTPLEQEARRVAEWVLAPNVAHLRRPGDRLWLATSYWHGAETVRVWAWRSCPNSPGAHWVSVEWPAGCTSCGAVGPRASLALEIAIAKALEQEATA